jgi:tRNA-specific 2-thiouridylase
MSSIAVALSGGVDSAVAALLSMRAGHDVIGVTMRLSHASDAAIESARAVCRMLGIAHEVIDLRERFEREVVECFAASYASGHTPNPCVDCNDRVKFGALLDHATCAGARRLATGHYARVVDRDGRNALALAADRSKDQTYFLYRLGPRRLEHVVFPVGELRKEDVRALAEDSGLPVAKRAESQEACFAPDQYASAVERRRPGAFAPGEIVGTGGNVLGTHDGIARFTIGQRKGLGIAAARPLYVVAIDVSAHRVVVGGRGDLEVEEIEAADVVWYGGPARGGCRFRFRHGTDFTTGTYEYADERLVVRAAEPVTGVAPGQALVCYNGEAVLGGGTIRSTR